MAALIDWDSSLSLDLPEIDAQHLALVQLINDLHAAMIGGKSQEVLGETLDRLIAYAESHFSTEEAYFTQSGFLQAVAHKTAHREFVDKVQEFKQDFAAKKVMLSMEIMAFLKDWLVQHIMGTDRKYVDAFKAAGIG